MNSLIRFDFTDGYITSTFSTKDTKMLRAPNGDVLYYVELHNGVQLIIIDGVDGFRFFDKPLTGSYGHLIFRVDREFHKGCNFSVWSENMPMFDVFISDGYVTFDSVKIETRESLRLLTKLRFLT